MMNAFIKKLKLRRSAFGLVLLVLMGLFAGSCEREPLEVKKDFPFDVSVMPIPKEIKPGQTVEMRFTIIRNGTFEGTKYYIRYFQFDGTGELQYGQSPPYLPNDLYPLPKQEFRLYYTSQSKVSQSFDVWISDNFGNEKQMSFQFNSKD